MTKTLSIAARHLAKATANAYSAAAFGDEWAKAADMLLGRGYTEREAEAILRSKHTRWCREDYEGSAAELARYIDRYPDQFSKAALAKLVKETF